MLKRAGTKRRVSKYFKKRLDFSCIKLYLFSHFDMSCYRNGGSEEKEKVGIDILKREGKPPYSLRILVVFSLRHGGDPTFGKFMKGGSDHVRR